MNAPFGPGCPWYGARARFGPPNLDWCEETVCAWVNEPANAWSNLAYIILGLWLWKSRRRSDPGASRLALALAATGACSFLYHASNNALTQLLDFFGMYLFFAYLALLTRRRGLAAPTPSETGLFWSVVLALTALTPLVAKAGIPIQLIIPAVASAGLALELRGPPRDRRLFWSGGVLLAVAGAFSALDLSRAWCRPSNHLLQGHALWHVFSAAGLALIVVHQGGAEDLPAGAKSGIMASGGS